MKDWRQKFTIQSQLIQKILPVPLFANTRTFKKKSGIFFFLIILFYIFFKIYKKTLDPDPNWAEIRDSDPNSMYLDPQHREELLCAIYSTVVKCLLLCWGPWAGRWAGARKRTTTISSMVRHLTHSYRLRHRNWPVQKLHFLRQFFSVISESCGEWMVL